MLCPAQCLGAEGYILQTEQYSLEWFKSEAVPVSYSHILPCVMSSHLNEHNADFWEATNFHERLTSRWFIAHLFLSDLLPLWLSRQIYRIVLRDHEHPPIQKVSMVSDTWKPVRRFLQDTNMPIVSHQKIWKLTHFLFFSFLNNKMFINCYHMG